MVFTLAGASHLYQRHIFTSEDRLHGTRSHLGTLGRLELPGTGVVAAAKAIDAAVGTGIIVRWLAGRRPTPARFWEVPRRGMRPAL